MFVVGLVAGAQFAVSLASRFVAGNQADHRGAKLTVIVGLLMAAAGVSDMLRIDWSARESPWCAQSLKRQAKRSCG